MVQVFAPSSVSEPSLCFPQTQDFGDKGSWVWSLLHSNTGILPYKGWCRPADSGKKEPPWSETSCMMLDAHQGGSPT